MNSLYKFRSRLLLRSISTTLIRNENALPPKPKKKPQTPITWKTITVTAVIGGGLTAFMLYLRKEKQDAIDRERKRELGKAKIGGAFELVNPEVNFTIFFYSF